MNAFDLPNDLGEDDVFSITTSLQEEGEYGDGEKDQNGYIDSPGVNDVLCGRGGLSNNNRANIRFRELIDSHRPSYIAASRQSKPKVSEYVVNLWKSQQPPGRFLSKVTPSGSSKKMWREVTDNMAKKKASQCLRARRVSHTGGVFGASASSTSSVSPSFKSKRTHHSSSSRSSRSSRTCVIRATMVPSRTASLDDAPIVSSSDGSYSYNNSTSALSDAEHSNSPGPEMPPLTALIGATATTSAKTKTNKKPHTRISSLDMLFAENHIPSTVDTSSHPLDSKDVDDYLFPQSSFLDCMAGSSSSASSPAANSSILNSLHCGIDDWSQSEGENQVLGQQIPCAAAITESIFADEDW